MEFETPSNAETQVELTSSGRRRIRPMKYNDFAGIKPKSASNENLVMRHPQHELETPIKESRRKRGDRDIIEMGSPAKGLADSKRVRCHASTAKGDERTSKRKILLDDDDIEIKSSKKQRLARESNSAKTPTRQTRGRSITTGTTARENVTPEIEKTRKRRRTTGAQSIDKPIEMENIRIKEEPRTSQPEITRFGKLTSAAERSHRETRLIAQIEIKSEHIEAPRRGRKPKQPIFESDTQSESTDAGRKFPPARSQRISRIESNYSVERRSSRNLSMQEQPNSPMTGASTEPSGDECLRPSDKRMSRRHCRRSKGQHNVEPEIMQIPSIDNQSDDDIDSVVDEEPLSSRTAKTMVADIFTKAAKRVKDGRKWNTSAMQIKGHGHRTSHRIAAAAAVSKCQPSPSSEHSASTHGGTSSDDQQISNKKQMTLPEMMQIQKAKHSAAEQMYV